MRSFLVSNASAAVMVFAAVESIKLSWQIHPISAPVLIASLTLIAFAGLYIVDHSLWQLWTMVGLTTFNDVLLLGYGTVNHPLASTLLAGLTAIGVAVVLHEYHYRGVYREPVRTVY